MFSLARLVQIPLLGRCWASICLASLLLGFPTQTAIAGTPSDKATQAQAASEQQIMLHLELAEVYGNLARNFACKLLKESGQTHGRIAADPSQRYNGVFNSLEQGKAFQVFLQTLREDHQARTLAEPCLTVVNGRQASFQCGTHSIPAPINPCTGEVQLPNGGLQITFLPTILPQGRIRLEVETIHCKPEQLRTRSSGHEVSSLLTTSFKSTAMLKDGQTMIIGLARTQGVPVKDNTDLVILVTVDLVNSEPADKPTPRQAAPSSPPRQKVQRQLDELQEQIDTLRRELQSPDAHAKSPDKRLSGQPRKR